MRTCILILCLAISLALPLKGSEPDYSVSIDEEYLTVTYSDSVSTSKELPVNTLSNPYRFRATDLIAPSAMIAIGVAGLEWKGLKKVNHKVTDALWNDGDHGKIRIDEVTQVLPIAANYGLNLCGVKGLHSYADLTIITGTASLLLAAVVYPTKDFVTSGRPDGTKFNSFPSGHSAWAFMGAEIMRREFSHISPWIGVSGYVVATGTAFLRLYNGAHWLTDVVAGAGIGILCAEAAYWLYPAISRHLFPKQYDSNIFLSPTIGRTSVGVAFSMSF